jgi:5-oxoprolinase (ATP-hydrolysing)
LPVPFGSGPDMEQAFTNAHQARFGFTSPERALLFEMLAVEAEGGGAALPDLASGDGAGQPVEPAGLGRGLLAAGAALPAGWLRDRNADRGPGGDHRGDGDHGGRAGLGGGGRWPGEPDPASGRGGGAPPCRGDQADPVLLEVFNNLFMSVADQMGATLANTAWSVNIKERLDFSCAIFDAAGDLVANAPHVPVHLGSMSHAVKTVIAAVGATAREGDAWMLNAPGTGARICRT